MIVWRAAAERSVDDYARYLAVHGDLAVGERFYAAVQATAERLARAPKLGHPARLRRRALRTMRYGLVDGFRNHLMYFRPIPAGIEIVDVVHGARDMEAHFRGSDE